MPLSAVDFVSAPATEDKFLGSRGRDPVPPGVVFLGAPATEDRFLGSCGRNLMCIQRSRMPPAVCTDVRR